MWNTSRTALSVSVLGTLLVAGALLQAGGPARVAAVAGPASFDESWDLRSDMIDERGGHIAAALPDGTVLVAGGSGTQLLKQAELYDPVANAWIQLPDMATPRHLAASASLPDGDVIVAGGCVTGCSDGADTATAERFDWQTRSWHAAGAMNVSRSRYHILLSLGDPAGRLLVVGGTSGYNTYLSSAEVYDPATNAWSSAGNMSTTRHVHEATRLADGRVLVTGGLNDGAIFASAEIYDPVSNSWSDAAPMSEARWAHAAVLLPSGKVLVSGGYGIPSGELPSATSELYDPDTDSWSPAAPLNQRRAGHQIALLDDGTALIVGGCGGTSPDCNTPATFLTAMLASAERFDPTAGPAGTWTTVAPMQGPRNGLSLKALCGNRAIAIGGNYPISTPLATTELYRLASSPDGCPPNTLGDPSLAPGRVIALPALNYHGVDNVCQAWVQVQNAGLSPSLAILVAWGEWDACATAPGPAGVTCSGLLAPGSAWAFQGPGLPNDAHSAVVYSFAEGTYGALDIGDTMCTHLSALGSDADYRAFHAAYSGGGAVAGIPMSAARGEPLAAVVYRSCPADQTPGAEVSSAYEGISDTMLSAHFAAGPSAYRYQIPLVLADSGQMNTQLYIQNTGLDCASVTLHFRAQDSCLPATACPLGAFTVPAGQMRSIDPVDCVGTGWRGSVELRSDQPLASVADLIGRDSLATYRGVSAVASPGAEDLVGPLYHSPETSWDSLVEVQNLGQASAEVQVTFHRSDGTVEATVANTLCKGSTTTFPLPVGFDAPTIQTGWIRVASLPDLDGDRQPLAAVARLIKYSDAQRSEVREASAYNLLPAREVAGAPINLPFAFKDLDTTGLTSEFQLAAGGQYRAGSNGTENIEHTYFDAVGPVAQYDVPLVAGHSMYDELAAEAGVPADLRGSLTLADTGTRARFSAAGVLRRGTRLGEDIPGDEAATYVGIPQLAPLCTSSPTGLVGWWPMDESGGISVPDLSVPGHSGALVGDSMTWRPLDGRVRGALEFSMDPLGHFARVPDAPELDVGAGDFSISAWAYVEEAAASMSNVILEKRMTTGHQGYLFYIRGGDTRRLELALQWDPAPGHNYFFTGPIIGTTFATNAWHHFAVTVERAGTTKEVKIYVDGVSQSVSASDGLLGLTGPTDISNNGPLTIGGSAISGIGFGGRLDEVQLFAAPLSSTAIQAIFDAGAAGYCLPEATATPTDTPSPTATDTPTSTSTPTPTDTPSPTATNTPSPTDTPSPSPTATHTPTFTPTSTYTPTPTFTPNPLCAPLPADLAAWWSLDETEGTLAGDRSSNHNDGSVDGSPGWDADGKVLRSFRFADASARFIHVPDANSIDVGSGNFSINAWVKLPVAPPGTFSTILDKRTIDGSLVRGYAFFLKGKTLGLQLADGKFANYIANAGVPADNAWHHIGVTIQRTTPRVILFYVDGVVSPTKFYPSATLGTLDNTAALRIGRHLDPSYGYFDGLLDELQLHRRTLTAAQISAIYKAGSAGICPPVP